MWQLVLALWLLKILLSRVLYTVRCSCCEVMSTACTWCRGHHCSVTFYIFSAFIDLMCRSRACSCWRPSRREAGLAFPIWSTAAAQQRCLAGTTATIAAGSFAHMTTVELPIIISFHDKVKGGCRIGQVYVCLRVPLSTICMMCSKPSSSWLVSVSTAIIGALSANSGFLCIHFMIASVNCSQFPSWKYNIE